MKDFSPGDDRIFRYIEMRIERPLLGLGDSVHSIHGGTEFEGEIRFSDICQMAMKYRALVRSDD